MTEPVFADLQAEKKKAVRGSTLRTQMGRNERGEIKRLYKLDLADDDFEAQFTKAFALSVARARRNRRRTPAACAAE